MNKWEYHTLLIELSPMATRKKLNEWGEQRWELVSILAEGAQYIRVFFKREKLPQRGDV
jgi:hypothetical protein